MDNVASLILTILAILVIIIFVGAFYAFFYAIFLFIFSAGDPEKIKKAWNSIRYMILGIVFTLIILFFFPIILEKAKIPGHDYYTANNIFDKVSKLTGGFINLGKDAISTYKNGGSIGEGGILIPSKNLPAKKTDSKKNTKTSSGKDDTGEYDDLEL